MNNTFDMNRFGLLIKKQWLEYGKLYLIVLGIVLGVIVAVYGYGYWDVTSHNSGLSSADYVPYNLRLEFRWPLFILLGMLFLSLAANQYFAPLGQKPKAILELTLPASSLEKFAVGLLYSSIFTLATYFIIFYFVDMAFVNKLKGMFPNAVLNEYREMPERMEKNQVPRYFFDVMSDLRPAKILYIGGAMIFSSIFLLGSLFFKKFQYVKTVITVMILITVWLLTVPYLGKMIFEDRTTISNKSIWNLSHNVEEWLMIGLLIIFAVVNWIIAYTRFKEKEV